LQIGNIKVIYEIHVFDLKNYDKIIVLIFSANSLLLARKKLIYEILITQKGCNSTRCIKQSNHIRF